MLDAAADAATLIFASYIRHYFLRQRCCFDAELLMPCHDKLRHTLPLRVASALMVFKIYARLMNNKTVIRQAR